MLPALAGCDDGVAVTLPTPAPVSGVPAATLVQRCHELQSHLPAAVAGQDRRDPVPASALTAAWGDPAVVLRCGVPEPGPSTQQCVSVDGVDWLLAQTRTGYTFRSYGRRPAVEVVVPHAYAPEVNALVDLAPAVKRLPRLTGCS